MLGSKPTPYDDDTWELYGPDDWTQAHDLAAELPDKLRELQRLFLIEATKYNVFPLDDRRAERFNPDLAGRPRLIQGSSQVLFGGMGRISESSVIALKNKSHSITASITVPERGAEGVIVSQGGGFGGWSIYAVDGRPAYCYNTFGFMRAKIRAEEALTAGAHQLRVEFAYDGGGLGKGADVSLYLDGKKVADGRVDATVPMVFSGDETTDVGSDTGTPVSDDYVERDNRFSGKVDWVQLDIDEAAEDLDHLITDEERYRVAMARQ
jgi:arylsulfatase